MGICARNSDAKPGNSAAKVGIGNKNPTFSMPQRLFQIFLAPESGIKSDFQRKKPTKQDISCGKARFGGPTRYLGSTNSIKKS